MMRLNTLFPFHAADGSQPGACKQAGILIIPMKEFSLLSVVNCRNPSPPQPQIWIRTVVLGLWWLP